MLWNVRLDHLSVSWSVCLSVPLFVSKVYCGKTADWMPFGWNGIGRGMNVLDGGGGSSQSKQRTREWFNVRKWTRQGDPVSPYVFITHREMGANKDLRVASHSMESA